MAHTYRATVLWRRGDQPFVASLSSCHMLFFLSFAARAGFRVETYEDEARGEMAKNAEGRFHIARVTLHPTIAFSGDRRPAEAELAALNHKSHAECFIANSVKTEVVIEPVPPRFA